MVCRMARRLKDGCRECVLNDFRLAFGRQVNRNNVEADINVGHAMFLEKYRCRVGDLTALPRRHRLSGRAVA